MMVFVNRMFSSSYILQRMPWVGKINKGLAVFVSLGVMTAVFGGIKIFRKMGSTFSAYETEPKESHTDRSSATGRQDSGSVIDTGAARTAGRMQNQSQKKAGRTRDRFAERVFIALFVTTVFLVLVSVLVAAVITPMLAGDTSAESLFEYTMNKILALLPYGALALVILARQVEFPGSVPDDTPPVQKPTKKHPAKSVGESLFRISENGVFWIAVFLGAVQLLFL